MPAPQAILDLVQRFQDNQAAYKSPKYNEATLRMEFLNPFFEALGWDIYNKNNYAEAYKDVVIEAAVEVEGAAKAPDYAFRIGGTQKFFVEAKKPSVNIEHDNHPAFQVRRYAWSAGLPLSILTDFEEFAVYDCRSKPSKSDPAATGRVMLVNYRDYAAKWDEIAARFSRDAVLKGGFDQFAGGVKGKRGTQEVDDAFLVEIETWREKLARNLALRNPALTVPELNYAVQMTIDRIIFLRICEDRGIERENQLKEAVEAPNAYAALTRLFQQADARYNSGLFHFAKEKDQSSQPDDLTLGLRIDDGVLKEIIGGLYYPAPYVFREIPTAILGSVYERFLGKVIRLTAGHQAKVEEKPEVRKAGGVYYTPAYIVDYIVKNTVGRLLEGKTPAEAAKLKIVDPACGSGSFLLGAYQCLLDWHSTYYAQNEPEKWAKGAKPAIYQGAGGGWRLTTSEKKRILLNNIHGVDIDPQAVEVTKLSLSLKVLEGENQESIGAQLSFLKERALPDLGRNIQCGNSLIGPDFFESQLFPDEEELRRVNPFDWQAAFPQVFAQGGFDAVIGNPPYGTVIDKKLIQYFNNSYQFQDSMKDWYLLFFEKYHFLLLDRGFLGIIISNTWLQSITLRRIREYLSTKYIWRKILICDNKVFSAIVDTHVLIFEKSKNRALRKNEIIIDELINGKISSSHTLESELIPEKGDPINIYFSTEHYNLFKKLSINSKELCVYFDVFNGAKPFEIGKGNPPQTKEIARNHIYVSEGSRPDISWTPLLRGSLINRYKILWNNNYWIKYGEWLAAPRDPKIFEENEKIMVRQTGDSIIATYVKSGFIARDNLHIILKKSVGNTSLFLLLGILNSRIINFAYTFINPEKGEALAQIKKHHVEVLPINVGNEDNKNLADEITECVKNMLMLNERIGKTPLEKTAIQREIESTDRHIDRLVYQLYGLTEEEIKIVEGG